MMSLSTNNSLTAAAQTANQKIRSILPVIKKDGAMCERNKFNEKRALGCLTIDKTKVNMHLIIMW